MVHTSFSSHVLFICEVYRIHVDYTHKKSVFQSFYLSKVYIMFLESDVNNIILPNNFSDVYSIARSLRTTKNQQQEKGAVRRESQSARKEIY